MDTPPPDNRDTGHLGRYRSQFEPRRTHAQVAAIVGLSRARVQQIEEKALKKLHKKLQEYEDFKPL